MSHVTELRVEGMVCGACVITVECALAQVAGVQKVRVSLKRKRARIHGNVDSPTLVEAVDKTGYKARTIE